MEKDLKTPENADKDDLDRWMVREVPVTHQKKFKKIIPRYDTYIKGI